jgi:hypothetical protein
MIFNLQSSFVLLLRIWFAASKDSDTGLCTTWHPFLLSSFLVELSLYVVFGDWFDVCLSVAFSLHAHLSVCIYICMPVCRSLVLMLSSKVLFSVSAPLKYSWKCWSYIKTISFCLATVCYIVWPWRVKHVCLSVCLSVIRLVCPMTIAYRQNQRTIMII